MPVRKINYSSFSVTGYVTLSCQPKPVWFESALERDFLYLMDFDRRVSRVEEQPLTINFECGEGKSRTYTPDFLATVHSEENDCTGQVLYEIKYEEELEQRADILAPKFDAAEAFAIDQGWEFKVLSEASIRTPYLLNAKFLRRFKQCKSNFAIQNQLDNILLANGPLPAGDALGHFHGSTENRLIAINQLWRMVSIGTACSDLSQPLTKRSLVWSIHS